MKIPRKEILNDTNWLKFKPLVFDSGEKQDEFNIQHVGMGHLVDTNLYGEPKFRKDKVKLVNCWTCRITGAHGFYTDIDKEVFVIKEHWLYNDWPEPYQVRIMEGNP